VKLGQAFESIEYCGKPSKAFCFQIVVRALDVKNGTW